MLNDDDDDDDDDYEEGYDAQEFFSPSSERSLQYDDSLTLRDDVFGQ